MLEPTGNPGQDELNARALAAVTDFLENADPGTLEDFLQRLAPGRLAEIANVCSMIEIKRENP